MNQKNILNFYSYSIEKFPSNQSYRFFWRYFGENLSANFITWKINWGSVALKFVGNLYLGIYLGILLHGKLFGD